MMDTLKIRIDYFYFLLHVKLEYNITIVVNVFIIILNSYDNKSIKQDILYEVLKRTPHQKLVF